MIFKFGMLVFYDASDSLPHNWPHSIACTYDQTLRATAVKWQETGFAVYIHVCTCNTFWIQCRCYVISHLPSLLVLDDHTITGEEREEARKVYGNRRLSVSSKRSSKKHKEKVDAWSFFRITTVMVTSSFHLNLLLLLSIATYKSAFHTSST